MSKVALIFAHPRLEDSKIHKQLLQVLPKSPNLTFHDLYENYPDFVIDIDREKKILLDHDVIIWQHPVYWYSCPPLLKQWMDMVLEIGWAYGPGGNALEGKRVQSIVSTGGPEQAYQEGGNNRFPLEQYFLPFEQTARLCKMEYLPLFSIKGSHRISPEQLQEKKIEYRQCIESLLELNNTSYGK
ncbi:MAG: NAD(P)H-dependent oxidoreductase [Cytophagaceae bacterium]|jgi:glutathione-regulated potassium-efflux system ancillary protein KefG|nr:NAD(P)H-dependent oxidoreductase [Cytophagaceae bacterium]